jgi:mannosyl-3-phosphoglycerate phosphatase family protein
MSERVPSEQFPVIFSDLDGTLLHPRTYSWDAALPALRHVQRLGIPLVLVSSKTRAEVEVWRERLGNSHPFIVENGGGIFIPDGYFPFPVEGELRGAYRVITLGLPYETVRKRFGELRDRLGTPVKGFGDMTAEEVADLTGLSREEAQLAQRRDFGEPFIFLGKVDDRFLQAIEGVGMRWTRGRLFHLMGDHHKGRAVKMLCSLFAQGFGPITTIGIGDGLNDLPFLLVVDRPVLVRKLSGRHEAEIDIPGLVRTRSVGPSGWNEAVSDLLAGPRSRLHGTVSEKGPQ